MTPISVLGRVVVAEAAGDCIPRHNQVVAPTAGNKDGRLEHVTHLGVTFCQRNPQVVDGLSRLCGDLTVSDDRP